MPSRKSTAAPVQPDLFDAAEARAERAARKRVRYFAYGSNADQEQMLARCPSARLLGTATLQDHCLVFAGNSPSRGGAVATVFACRGFQVPGALYSITRSDLAMLDQFEGVPWVYVRTEKWVETSARRRRAAVYWLRSEHVATGIRRPAAAYLGQIMLAYRRLGIPRDSLALALDIADRVTSAVPPTQTVGRKKREKEPLTSNKADPTYASRRRPAHKDSTDE